MKNQYTKPEVEIISIQNKDVITLSVGNPGMFNAGSNAGVSKDEIPF